MRLWLELHWWTTAISSRAKASRSTWRTITFSLIKYELGPRESSQWRPITDSYINSKAAHIYDQYIDEDDFSSIIIMQDDGIHVNLRYTQQAYIATVMKVTHAIFVQFPDSWCVVFK